MNYKAQQSLLSGTKDPSVFNFLKTVDNYLVDVNTFRGAPGVILTEDITVTTDFTYSHKDPQYPGQILVVFFAQDATGHAVTWGSNFVNPGAVSATALTYTVELFFGRANNTWVLIGANTGPL